MPKPRNLSCRAVLLVAVCCASAGFADVVRLTDGRELAGQILSESQYEVQLLVARNAEGTLRTVRIIDRSLVESMARGAEPVRIEASGILPQEPTGEDETGLPDAVPGDMAQRLDRVESYLKQTDGLLAEGQYDSAIQRFETVAASEQIAALHRGKADETALRAVDLQIRAYKMWSIGLEGKREQLEELQDGREDEIRANLRDAEDRLRDLDSEKRRAERDDTRELTRMKSRDYIPGAVDEEERLKETVERYRDQQLRFEEWKTRNELEVLNLESEVELIREKVKQLERARSTMERTLTKKL